jgi:hypothetical protein
MEAVVVVLMVDGMLRVLVLLTGPVVQEELVQ